MANIDFLSTSNSGPVDFSFGSEETETNKEALQEQLDTIRDLMPDVEFLQTYVSKEIDAVSDIRSYMKTLGPKPDALTIEIEYRARELYIEFLQRFKGDVNNQLANAESEVTE